MCMIITFAGQHERPPSFSALEQIKSLSVIMNIITSLIMLPLKTLI